jgi:hypothetical protein
MRFSPETLCRVSQILTSETPEVLEALKSLLLAKRKKPADTAGGWRRFPSEWEPGQAEIKLANDLRLDITCELEKIRDHEFQRARKDATATFRNWLRNAARYDSGPRVAPRPHLRVVQNETLLERAARMRREEKSG